MAYSYYNAIVTSKQGFKVAFSFSCHSNSSLGKGLATIRDVLMVAVTVIVASVKLLSITETITAAERSKLEKWDLGTFLLKLLNIFIEYDFLTFPNTKLVSLVLDSKNWTLGFTQQRSERWLDLLVGLHLLIIHTRHNI